MYYYPWLRPVSTQHRSQLPREHTTHAAIIGAVLLKHITITSCQLLIFNGSVNQSPHDSIAAHRASNLWPFGYESYDLTYYMCFNLGSVSWLCYSMLMDTVDLFLLTVTGSCYLQNKYFRNGLILAEINHENSKR